MWQCRPAINPCIHPIHPSIHPSIIHPSIHERSDFRELWEQSKQLKNMEICEVSSNTYNEGYIHQFHTLTRFSSKSSRSPKYKNILPWNTSQIIMKVVQISTRIIKSCVMKRNIIPLWVLRKINGNWDHNAFRISQWMESHCRLKILWPEYTNKFKSARLPELHSGFQEGKLNIWIRLFKLQQSSPSLLFSTE